MLKKITAVLFISSSVMTSTLAKSDSKDYSAAHIVKNANKLDVARVINLKPIEVIAERIHKVSSFAKNDKPALTNSVNDGLLEDNLLAVDTSNRKTDTTEIKVGKTRIIVIGEPKIDKIYMEQDSLGDYESDDYEYESYSRKHKKVKTNYFGMDLGFNALLDNGSMTMSTLNKNLELNNRKSINFSLNLFTTRVNIVKEYVQFSYGIGLDYNNYRFSKNISFTPDKDTVTLFFQTDANGNQIKYKKNKLLAKYVTLPLMLQFNSKSNKKNNGFRVAGGVELGYLINGRTKQVYGDKKEKVADDFNLNDFRYGFVGRIGYGDLALFAKYYPNSVFAKNEGPDLNTVCVGIALTGF